MKIENTKVATVTTDVPQGDVTPMTIDAAGMEHIMSLLTNLYQDPELAVIREYYTNALDAHAAVGNTEPVEILLPTWDVSSYVVKDSGVGMSAEDIRNIYARYGASTKRDTNDQVGAFGLGCKSALTIATQFTVVSVKNGEKTTVLISKKENGAPSVNIVSCVRTDEPNGTTIKVPVGHRDSFNSKARHFFQFSRPGMVLVDGKQPEYALDSATSIDIGIEGFESFIDMKNGSGSSYIVMGNVPYALSVQEQQACLRRLGIGSVSIGTINARKYFKVPIGAIDLTPSREGIQSTDKTNAAVDMLMSRIIGSFRKIAQKALNDVTDRSKVHSVRRQWNYYLPLPDQLTEWNGQKIQSHVPLTKAATYYLKDRHSSNTAIYQKIFLDNESEIFLVKAPASGQQFDTIKRNFSYFLKNRGKSTGSIYVTDAPEAFSDPWITDDSTFTVLDYDTITEEAKEYRAKLRKERKAQYPVEKKKIEYAILDVDDKSVKTVPYDEIPAGTPYLHTGDCKESGIRDLISDYYSRGFAGVYEVNVYSRYLKKVTVVNKIVLIGGSRTAEAYQKRVKDSKPLHEVVKPDIERYNKEASDEVRRYCKRDSVRMLSCLKQWNFSQFANRLADKKLAGLLQRDAEFEKEIRAIKEKSQAWKALGLLRIDAVNLNSIDTALEIQDELRATYPLLAIMTSSLEIPNKEHLLLYLNSAYELTKAKA